MFFLQRVRQSVALVLAWLLVPLLCQAATLANRTDVMTRQQVSQSSNHAVQVTTPTGVDANTDTITVTFPSGFNLSTIVVGDIALLHGPVTGLEVTEVLAVTPAAGVWGAVRSGQVITFTAPTDAALGEIAASDIITIRVGTNAGGIHQITNPTTAGTYNISFGGTFGDDGGISVPIINPGSIDISATIASTSTPPGGGGGGGGGPPPGDTTAPALSNIRAINITPGSVQITWDTNEASNSFTEVGRNVFYSDGSASNTTLVVSHSLSVSGLLPDTLYHFRVRSTDAAGNTAASGDFTFRTLPAPIITNVRVNPITQTNARVLWDTNILANSLVEYGLTPAYGSTVNDPAFVTAHDLALSGLTQNTLYHYRITSVEPSGLTVSTGDLTFTTLGDTTPPTNPFGFSATPAVRANNLSWSNPADPDFVFVRILARTDHYPTNPTDGRLVYQGGATSIVDSGLTEGVRVFYTNFAADSSNNFSSGALADAVPLAPPVPPAPTSTPPVVPPPTSPGSGLSTPPVRPPTRPPTGGVATTTPPVVTPPAGTTTTPPVIPPTEPATTTEPTVSVAPTSTPSVVTPPVAPSINPEYFGAAGNIALRPDAQGRLGALANQPVLVRIPVQNLSSRPVSGSIQVGESRYALTELPGGQAWGASFVPAQNANTIPATVSFHFENQTDSISERTIQVRAAGRVSDQNTRQGVDAVRIYIFELQGTQEVPYKAANYGQPYPIVTDRQGEYGLIVPNGRYRIRAEKDGYDTSVVDVDVSNNVLSRDITINRSFILPPILQLIQSEPVKKTANIIAPIAAIVAIAATASALSAFNVLTYLYFLFSQPLLLLGRRKRLKWGIVYNALTKLPIELAVVRLIQADTKQVVQTRITDAKGRYSFLARPGRYRIEIRKPGYLSPSVVMKEEQVDIDYVDLYHGDAIEVKEETTLVLNIPIDPLVKEEPSTKIRLMKFLRKLQNVIGLISAVVTLIALIIAPSWVLFVLFVAQVVLYFLFRRLALPRKPKEWGFVHEDKNRAKRLDSTVIRIFDKKFNKLLETQITNKSGKYGFIVGRNTYYVTAQRTGYESFRSPDIDLTKSGEHLIDQPIALKPQGAIPPKVQ